MHPEGKQGVRILKRRYTAIKEAIINSLAETPVLTFNELCKTVDQKVKDSFDGEVMWYVTNVKLDLEARGIIQRIPNSRPQKIRLKPSRKKVIV